MSDERPLEGIEALDDWDDDDRPPSPRRSPTWLIGPIALVAVAAIVIAVVVGGTKPTATNPVTPPPSSAATASATGQESTSPTTVPSQSAIESASPASVVLPALASDDPAEPLRISLLDPKPQAPSAGLIAYKVQICVSDRSAGVASDKVRVAASNWQLARFDSSDTPQPGVPSVAPQFPSETLLGKGECASGYVTFAWGVVEAPNALVYSDKRFGWYWRLS